MMNYWSPLGTAAFWSVLGFLSVAAVLIWFSFRPYKREEPDQVSDALDALSDVSEETLRHIQAEYPFPYLSVVHYDTSNVPAHQIDTTVSLRAGRDYLFMGLLPDRPGLCMVADSRSGQIYISNTKMFRK